MQAVKLNQNVLQLQTFASLLAAQKFYDWKAAAQSLNVHFIVYY